MKKAIIFDYDGVLVDSLTNAIAAYREVFRHLGLPEIDDDDNSKIAVSGGFINCLRGLGIADEDIKEASLIYRREILKREHAVFPGISKLLADLSERYSLFVVSASHSDEMSKKLERYGLADYFLEVFGGADNNIRKSDLMTGLMNKYNYRPEEVISVGDRNVDYQASIAAKIPDENIILVRYGWGLDESQTGGAMIVDSPAEIGSAIISMSVAY